MRKDYIQIANDVGPGLGVLRQGATRYGEGLVLFRPRRRIPKPSTQKRPALPYNCHNVRIIAASQFNQHEQETTDDRVLFTPY